MPKNASPAKVSATRGLWCKCHVLEGNNYDESWAKAQKIAENDRC